MPLFPDRSRRPLRDPTARVWVWVAGLVAETV